MPAKQQRRIVFFLGAGAPYGAGAVARIQGGGTVRIPIQATFWDTFLRFCKGQQNRHKIESLLFRYFLGYKKMPGRAKAAARRAMLKPIDVEEVFTFLSERNHAPTTSIQFQAYTKKVWEALVEEIGEVFARFRPSPQTRKIFREFSKKHIRSRDTVVSFNYDVVFEYSLPERFDWYYGVIDEDHYPYTFRILKPHGSVNWQEINGKIEAADAVHHFPIRPIVIAPTHLKFIGTGDENGGTKSTRQTKIGYLNQSDQIADVWGAMEREMRAAKALIFIGYSFPPSDLYFSSVLRSILAVRDTSPYVVIVNPDAMAIRARLNSRFSIPIDQIRTFQDLQTFNQLSRSQLLKMF